MAVDFYRNLFSAQENTQLEEVLRHVPAKVTDLHNNLLYAPFTETEIRTRRVHGRLLPAALEPVRGDISKAALEFLNGGSMPTVVNETTLVLIPKVKNLQELTQFRLIALCNVLYKICSKVIANRLCLVLDDIVSEEQSAFVPGRLITDNVLVAYEHIHYLKKKKRQDWSLCSET
jgi:hypothetical protein